MYACSDVAMLAWPVAEVGHVTEDMEVLIEAAHQASRQRWREEGVIRDPPDPVLAETIARAKRPCLKPIGTRNPEWDPTLNEIGQRINEADCKELIEKKVWQGQWKRVTGEAWRTQRVGRARTYIMEFVVATEPAYADDFKLHHKEIKLAGYTHWSLCNLNGWEPFKLLGDRVGWGKEVVDPEELYEWHSQRQFSLPTRHPSGDGWVYKGDHYTRADWPNANEYSPLGEAIGWDDVAFA